MRRIAEYRGGQTHSHRNSILAGHKLAGVQIIGNAERGDLNAMIDDEGSGRIKRASELRKGAAACDSVRGAKDGLNLALVYSDFVDQTLSAVVRRKVDCSTIGSPSRRPRAPVQIRSQLASTISTRRRNPNVSVFRDAIDRCDVAPGGGVSDPFPIRRPRRFVFAARCLRNLTDLGLQIDGEDIGVVIRVRIGFVI